MTARLRQRDLRVSVCGSYKTYVGGTSNVIRCVDVGDQDSVQDEVGDRTQANPLSIYHITKQVPFLNGQRYSSGGVLEREFIGFPIGNAATNPVDPRSVWGTPSVADLNELAWEILSKTNPSRPDVNVPAALGELHDLPKLVKGYGDGLLRGAARGNLSWRFAVKPMISDIRKLARFGLSVNKRMRWFKKLRDEKSMRTRCNLGQNINDSGLLRMLIHSQGAAIYAFRRNVSHYNMWGTAEWKLLPDSVLADADDGELNKLAHRTAAGITSYGALETAWELTPWSWLVDWFSNVGDMVAALNNTVGLTWGRICVMRQSETRTTYDLDPTGTDTWPTFSGWYNVRFQRKERWPTYPIVPVPLPSLPALTGGQLSILLSLAALRR